MSRYAAHSAWFLHIQFCSTQLRLLIAIATPKMTVLNVGRLAGSGVWHVPKCPTDSL
jgi:hypothetical protein